MKDEAKVDLNKLHEYESDFDNVKSELASYIEFNVEARWDLSRKQEGIARECLKDNDNSDIIHERISDEIVNVYQEIYARTSNLTKSCEQLKGAYHFEMTRIEIIVQELDENIKDSNKEDQSYTSEAYKKEDLKNAQVSLKYLNGKIDELNKTMIDIKTHVGNAMPLFQTCIITAWNKRVQITSKTVTKNVNKKLTDMNQIVQNTMKIFKDNDSNSSRLLPESGGISEEFNKTTGDPRIPSEEVLEAEIIEPNENK